VLRPQAIGETQGLMKILVGANDDRILGFAMIGSEAGEVMAVVQTAIIAGPPHARLRDAVLFGWILTLRMRGEGTHISVP
jgi:pyruvate/2-oxoglutarate dehydrogenase complex dihydrolipoamide dehydrogenase (E3) component